MGDALHQHWGEGEHVAPTWPWLLGVAALYVVLGLIVHRYIISFGLVSIVWPGSGLALAAVLIGGRRFGGAVLLGSLVLNALSVDSVWAIGGMAIANALEALVGAWLIERRRGPLLYLDSLTDYLRFLALGGLASVVAALIGPLSLIPAGIVHAQSYLSSAWHWWMGDLLGIALVAPLLLAWRSFAWGQFQARSWIEALALLALTILAGQIVFLNWFHEALGQATVGYWVFLVVTLVAIRLNSRGATLAVAVLAFQALLGAYLGLGMFAGDIAQTGLKNYWAYMLVLSMVAMAVSANFKANRDTLQALRLKDQALDVAANGIVVTDRHGHIEWANQEFSRVTGYSLTEATGRRPGELVKSGQHDSSHYQRLWATILAGRVWHGEMVNRRKDGTLYDEEMTITPLLDAQGEIAHFVAVKQDISWRKRIEKYEQFRSQVLETLASDAPLAQVLDKMVRGVERLRPAMLCSVLLLDDERLHLGKVVAPSLPDFYNAAIDGTEIGMGEGSCGTAAYTGQRVVVADIRTHPYWVKYKHLALQAELRACWSEPIVSAQGQVLGTFAIYHREPQVPDADDLAIIEQCAHLASIAIERKYMEDQVRHLAFNDGLTHLPNRRLLSDRLGRALGASKRHHCFGALMFLDMDNFKELNDAHGHAVGDLLLVEVARRLVQCVREVDTVARFGGDEFVVMLTELHADPAVATAQAQIVASKILTSLSEPYLLTPKSINDRAQPIEHHCTASIGIVGFIDHQGGEEEIMKWADTAMYQAKKAGGNRIVFYKPEA